MKEYILNKNLPFAKIGAEVILKNMAGYVMNEYNHELYYLAPVGILDEGGWIKKNTPKEFYLALNKEDKIVGFTDNYEGVIPIQNKKDLPVFRVIKVREVDILTGK